MLSQNEIFRISDILKNIPNLACAYLHGSALTSHFRPESDIDIALLFFPSQNDPFPAEDSLEYGIEIESVSFHSVHFSLLSSHNTVFAKEVITKGRLIICNDSNFCKTFRMHILSMYLNLNWERREILEQYTA